MTVQVFRAAYTQMKDVTFSPCREISTAPLILSGSEAEVTTKQQKPSFVYFTFSCRDEMHVPCTGSKNLSQYDGESARPRTAMQASELSTWSMFETGDGVHSCVHFMTDVQSPLSPHLEDVVQECIQWCNWARFKECLCLYTRNNSKLFIPACMLNVVCGLVPFLVVS